MKILWITNIPIAHQHTMMGNEGSVIATGSWLVAAYEGATHDNSIELHTATIYDGRELLHQQKDGANFYLVPRNRKSYNIDSAENKAYWQKVRELAQPDAVIIWGTETKWAALAARAMSGIPIAIYIQGVINSIYDHFFDGVPQKYRLMTPRDLFDKLSPASQLNGLKNQRTLENEILSRAQAVIVENDWCESQCLAINPNLKVYRNNLPIRKEFLEHEWSEQACEPHTIFTNAGGYPIKGHHILLQALAYVKKKFPDVKLYIPGMKYFEVGNSIKRSTGYLKFLRRIISENNLQENIVFTGTLDVEGMGQYLSKCNVYAMPSVCENHSSSLIEALMVGAPCVSSLVGGVASLVKHGEDALIYNSLEPLSLAGNIMRVFSSPKLATDLSEKAKAIRVRRNGNFGNEMKSIYSDLATK